MKIKLTIAHLLLICTLTLIQSCSSDKNESSTNDTSSKASADELAIHYPYKYIDTRRELRKNDNLYNEMILYVCGKHINEDTLKMFCKSKKDSISDGVFHIITFFDDTKHAKFTKFPVTAMYGFDDELSKHIKAEYTYNVMNGYSKLTIYEKNSYVSAPKEFDIN